MTSKELHRHLADQGIRLFHLSIDINKYTFIHTEKTVQQWRADVREFTAKAATSNDHDGFAAEKTNASLFQQFQKAGYIEADDLISDVYEGRTASPSAYITDDPSHKEQSNGFGHYGWESEQ